MLSSIIFTLFTHDCTPIQTSNPIVKCADDATVEGLISDNDETAYWHEESHLAKWCEDNNLVLNTFKTKDVLIDFWRSKGKEHLPLHISRQVVERVECQVPWSQCINPAFLDCQHQDWSRKRNGRLFHLKLRNAQLPQELMLNLYHQEQPTASQCGLGAALLLSGRPCLEW